MRCKRDAVGIGQCGDTSPCGEAAAMGGSTPVDSVWANPKELALASDQLPRLAKALKRDKNELARRVTSNLDREFLYLARHMQPADAQKIRALEIPGVYLMREYRRFYPAGEVAGHIIGFTSVDDEGQEGSSSRSITGSRARTAPSA